MRKEDTKSLELAEAWWPPGLSRSHGNLRQLSWEGAFTSVAPGCHSRLVSSRQQGHPSGHTKDIIQLSWPNFMKP